MSKKHADEILAAVTGVLLTDVGRAHAFSYLAGVLSAMADDGRPVSATRLAGAVVSAVEEASKNRAERKAREEEQAWRLEEEGQALKAAGVDPQGAEAT